MPAGNGAGYLCQEVFLALDAGVREENHVVVRIWERFGWRIPPGCNGCLYSEINISQGTPL